MEDKKGNGNDNAVIQINPDTEETRVTEKAKNLNSAASRGDEYEKEEKEEEEEEEEKEDQDIIVGKIKEVSLMLELIMFVSIMWLLIASLTLKRLQNHVIWDLELWKWCLLALVILSGPLLSRCFISVIVFLVEKKFMLKHLVLYFVYGLRTSVSVFIWLTCVLLVWIFLFDDGYGVKGSKETSKIFQHVTRTLASFVAGAAVWFVKTLSVKLISVSFQSKRFFHRIHEAIFHQHVLQVLSAAQENKIKKLRTANTAMQFISRISKRKKSKEKMTIEKISACISKRLFSSRNSDLKSSQSNEIDESNEIKSESEAKILADNIIKNLEKLQSEFIEKKQLQWFLKDEQHVKKVLKLFGAVKSGKIDKADFKKWVTKVYNDRQTLKRSLNDAKTAIEELNRILSAIVIVLIIIVWLLVMGLLTYKVFAVVTSQLLLLAFMFGNTARTCFEAIIFVFVTHPFDVGDRCLIDGVLMVVDEMNILTTIFLRYDKQRIYYPNSVLATKPISNFYRSPREMGDTVEFAIDVFTSVEIIDKLKYRIKDYLERKHKHWSGDHSVVVKDIEDVNKMRMTLYVTHTMNFQDYMKKLKRRSKLVLELKKIFEELGIRYNLLPQEVRVSYAGR
ncbi:Mechanosensitive ion channel protein [Citrus sinensis]|uniref:mechanosensitive ion channel protein 10-like isoform X2 n=1 Tax=Citrus sinensis TaxID=2711 RepID=UPI00219CEC3C|nr:mechanosensitive ion channel protein 10-like isoform X2 [Citrus sinensis]KAH9669591.1 Mechanosensitive ion channel protein [Citrus sinensis]